MLPFSRWEVLSASLLILRKQVAPSKTERYALRSHTTPSHGQSTKRTLNRNAKEHLPLPTQPSQSLQRNIMYLDKRTRAPHRNTFQFWRNPIPDVLLDIDFQEGKATENHVGGVWDFRDRGEDIDR